MRPLRAMVVAAARNRLCVSVHAVDKPCASTLGSLILAFRPLSGLEGTGNTVMLLTRCTTALLACRGPSAAAGPPRTALRMCRPTGKKLCASPTIHQTHPLSTHSITGINQPSFSFEHHHRVHAPCSAWHSGIPHCHRRCAGWPSDSAQGPSRWRVSLPSRAPILNLTSTDCYCRYGLQMCLCCHSFVREPAY
jgi:hypothetical protein